MWRKEQTSLVSRWLCLPWRVLCEAACGRLERDPWDPDVKGTQDGEGHVWGTRGRRGCWDRRETWRCFKCIWSRHPSWSAALLIAKYESPTSTFNSVCNYSSRAVLMWKRPVIYGRSSASHYVYTGIPQGWGRPLSAATRNLFKMEF